MSSRVGSAEGERHDPCNKGPIKNRGCTDILCLLIFIAFLGGWVAVAVYGFIHGNPLILVYPSDSSGKICGRGDLSSRPYLMFFDITKCLRPGSVALGCPTKQVCVEKCPDKIRSPWAELNAQPTLENAIRAEIKPFCDPEKYSATVSLKVLMSSQVCPEWFVPSSPFIGRCIPFFDKFNNGSSVSNASDVLFPSGGMSENYQDKDFTVGDLTNTVKRLAEVLNLRTFGEKVISDVVDTWWIILVGVLLASLVSFLWIILMRFVAAVMVWASIILSVAFLALSCVYCGYRFSQLYSAGDSFNDFDFTTNFKSYLDLSYTWLVFLIISGIALLIVLLLLCFMRTRIKIAIELIEEASIAVGHMISTLFFPLVPFVLEVMLIAWFILVGAFLASSNVKEHHVNINGKKSACTLENSTILKDGQKCWNESQTFSCLEAGTTAECQFYKYGPTTEATIMQVYNLFGFFWGFFFLEAFDQMVLAGAFASWYWTLDKRDTPKLPLMSSFFRTLRYHIGTLAFGSLIIAVIRMIKVMIEYIEEKLKEYHQDNPIAKCMICFCKCCFECLERFMKFLNRNAYIMTAVYGKNFCWSAKEAFSLLLRNMARVFVLDKVTDFLLLLGKLVIVGGVGVSSFYVFSGRIDVKYDLPQLNYYFVPIIIITISAYFIADVFFGVYEMGVDTLFLCFLEDIERNNGSLEKPYFMSKDLKKILGYLDDKSRPTSSHKQRPNSGE